MLTRILIRSRPAASRAIVRAAVVLLAPSLSLADSVPGSYVWPADGAPVCNAAGDQHRLINGPSSCGGLNLVWLDSSGGTDSLSFGGVDIIPPTGECPRVPVPVDASGADEIATAEIRSGLIAVALPYCVPQATAEAWTQGSGAASQVAAHVRQWLDHERIVVDDGDFVRHHARLSGSGNAFMDTAVAVVWSDERTGVPQIRAQRVNWSGAREWGASGVLVAPTGVAQSDPEVARLGDGSVLVVWLDARSGGSDVFAMRLLPDGSPAPGWTATGLALEARPEASASPHLVGADAFDGPAYVVWEESGPRFGGGRSIVARRLLADGMPDPTWDPQGVPITTSATVDHLQDATARYDDLLAVWTDTRAATASNPTDLFAAWLGPSGSPEPGWPASGRAICTAGGRQDAARMSATNTYVAFAWEDHRGTDADVYAELRYADGTLLPGKWVADGLPATSAPGDQTAPVVGVGNGGGCFVAWEDARDLATNGLDIYAQAFTSEGDKLDVPSGPPPSRLSLGAPRPNPSRGTSLFTLDIPTSGAARIDVMDVAGRRVRSLAAREFAAGTREMTFDGLDDAGRALPPGIYRVRARFGGAESSRTIILVR